MQIAVYGLGRSRSICCSMRRAFFSMILPHSALLRPRPSANFKILILPSMNARYRAYATAACNGFRRKLFPSCLLLLIYLYAFPRPLLPHPRLEMAILLRLMRSLTFSAIYIRRPPFLLFQGLLAANTASSAHPLAIRLTHAAARQPANAAASMPPYRTRHIMPALII